MTVLTLMRNRFRDTEKLLKIRKFFQQNTEKVFWRLTALLMHCGDTDLDQHGLR